jgi:hypothetical protein
MELNQLLITFIKNKINEEFNLFITPTYTCM